MSPIRMHVRRTVRAAMLWGAATLAASAAPPIAPSPEPDGAVDPRVEPASLTLDAEAATRPEAAPLPLTGTPAPRAVPPQPLPDWRLLAALGAAFAVLAGYRVLGGRKAASLPPDVFEVLGDASLGGQQAVRIVRFGPRTLLVGISSAGCQTLAELTDSQATEAIVAACRAAKGLPVAGRSVERRKEVRG